MTDFKNWFIGTTNRVNGVLVERHYGFFQVVTTGEILHANNLEELEVEIKNSSLFNRS